MATLVSELDLPYLDASALESREERLAALAAAQSSNWLVRSPLGYAITRHDDVTALLRDRRWHSAVRLIRQLNGMPPEEGERESILSAEGDVHSRLRRLVAPEVCEYVIAHAASRLGPSLTYDPVNGGMMRDPLRTSSTASLSPIDLDLALVALNRLIAHTVGVADKNGEFLSVLHYRPGQQYHPHCDWLPAGPDLERSGQRAMTALLFLNDDYRGGETHFLAPDLKIRGRTGDLLVFSNLDAQGAPDPLSRHAGLPIENGEKWIASKWFRSKEYQF